MLLQHHNAIDSGSACRKGVLPALSTQLPPSATEPSLGLHFSSVQRVPSALFLQSVGSKISVVLHCTCYKRVHSSKSRLKPQSHLCIR